MVGFNQIDPVQFDAQDRSSFKDVLSNHAFDNTGILSQDNFSSGSQIGTGTSETNDFSSPFMDVTGAYIDFNLERQSKVMLFGQFQTRVTTDAGADPNPNRGVYQVPLYNRNDLNLPIAGIGTTTTSGTLDCASFGWTILFVQEIKLLDKGFYRLKLRHRPNSDAVRTIVNPSTCLVGYVILGT